MRRGVNIIGFGAIIGVNKIFKGLERSLGMISPRINVASSAVWELTKEQVTFILASTPSADRVNFDVKTEQGGILSVETDFGSREGSIFLIGKGYVRFTFDDGGNITLEEKEKPFE